MHEIDGSYGEGGGQLVRTSVALAAITGQCVHLFNIRAKRNNPGLAPQHFTGVKAVAELCKGTVEGLEAKTREITFRPGSLHGGEFDFHVGTAGSITLVLQAALPAAVACHEPVLMNITGGTDVPAAPPLDYFRYILLPLLSQIGIKAKIEVQRRGYYPRGGGSIAVKVEPSPAFEPLVLEKPGELAGIRGFAHISNLPGHIIDRMTSSALAELAEFPAPAIDRAEFGRDKAIGSGGAILLSAEMSHNYPRRFCRSAERSSRRTSWIWSGTTSARGNFIRCYRGYSRLRSGSDLFRPGGDRPAYLQLSSKRPFVSCGYHHLAARAVSAHSF